jgi:DNA recombination protein RmuC
MNILLILILCILIVDSLITFILYQKVKTPAKDDSKMLIELGKSVEMGDKMMREEVARIRQESQISAKDTRSEISQGILEFGNSIQKQIANLSGLQRQQMDSFSKQVQIMVRTNSEELEKIRVGVEQKMEGLQKDNAEQLEKMRATVDEKLQSTLEKRLTESFKSVSDRLEQVHKGLGEMQTLASGVGDLKKVLSNVKTRGTWGEVQLGNLLEQILTPSQYDTNVPTKKGSNGRVEFAIKLPGKDEDLEHVWLPIDAKFPIEDYQRLIEFEEVVDKEGIIASKKALEKRLKDQAKTIRELYVDPPYTTDFAMMYLPVEGLYAEVLKIPGFVEMIQREYRVIITGPTTITAILNSLQMGFRTLAIEKQSSQIWKTLSEVKTEFGRFGDILEKTQKKLQEASNQIDAGAIRARAIERKLRRVDVLPSGEKQPSSFLADGTEESE